jgi:hypothetical protein
MELFRRSKPEESFDEFWRRTGEKRGGTVGIFTFATFLGRSGAESLSLPGLMYTVGDMVWFEDFERDNWLARIFGGKRQFLQTEVGFPRSEVTSTRTVSRGTAYRCVRGGVTPEQARAMSPFLRVFSTPVLQVVMDSGQALYFEIMKLAEIKRFLDK